MKRWSFADQRQLITVAASARSFDEIVKQMGRKPESIRKMAIKLGIGLKEKIKP